MGAGTRRATPQPKAGPIPWPKPTMLTLREVAQQLGVSIGFVKKLVRCGRLPVVELSPRCLRVEATDLTALRDSCRRQPRG